MPSSDPSIERKIGRYVLYGAIASGGMATVHFGRLLGSGGFARTVAIKRLHPQYAREQDFVDMFLDEARLAARIRHPNVVPTLDVIAKNDELLLVMEYVEGESLSRLAAAARAADERIPANVASAVLVQALRGLHAAHEAVDEEGHALGIVHRDVSPQNILVGTDGVARIADFGVAKAAGRLHTTRDGGVKGKLAYMAPEQLHGRAVDRRADVYAAGVVLWEMLTGTRLFRGESDGAIVTAILEHPVRPPSSVASDLPRRVDDLVLRALAREPTRRFATAAEMANALQACLPPAGPQEVGEWVKSLATDTLTRRGSQLVDIERRTAARARGDDEATTDVSPHPPFEANAASMASMESAASIDPLAGRRSNRRTLLLLATLGVVAAITTVALRRRADDAPVNGTNGAAASTAVATTSEPEPSVASAASVASTETHEPTPAASIVVQAAPATATSTSANTGKNKPFAYHPTSAPKSANTGGAPCTLVSDAQGKFHLRCGGDH